LWPVLAHKLLCPVHKGEGQLNTAIVYRNARLQISNNRAAVINMRPFTKQTAIEKHVVRDRPAIHADEEISSQGVLYRTRNKLPCA